GLQPATGVELPIAVEKNVKLARMLIGDRYLLTGFAIRRPGTAAALIRSGADAVVVGSAIIRLLEEKGVDEAGSLACGIYQAVHSVNAAEKRGG
ncbi:MAG TPA: tryptophan synthase subunit alpha, partial [Pyrodictium sp.]|nr:tryptophan synthase subunit alpha [Pyrodictium sp.]